MKYILAESSLSRIFQHIEDRGRSFGVVSAYRSDLPDAENKERHEQMKTRIRSFGLGFIELRGGYKGDQGFVTELSLFIPSISRSKLIDLGKEFNQHSVLYKDQNEFSMIGTNASSGIGVVMSGFAFGTGRDNLVLAQDAMKEFFSQLLKGTHRGRKFLFQLKEHKVLGFFEYVYLRHHDKDINGSMWSTVYEETE